MSLAKIPIQKTIFGIPFFNGTYFTIGIVLFIIFVALMQISHVVPFMKKRASILIIIILLIVVYSYWQFGHRSITVRAEELMTFSLMDEIIAKKQLSTDQLQIGLSILTAFFANVFQTSTDFGLSIVIGILLISLLIQIIMLVSNSIKKRRFLCIDNVHSFNTNPIFSLHMEEIVTANVFLLLGTVNIWWFKILLGIIIVYSVALLFTKKRGCGLFFIKTLILMVCINPLLIGFILRY